MILFDQNCKKSTKSQQRTPELVGPVRLLCTNDNKDWGEAILWYAEVIEFVLSNMSEVILSVSVGYSRLANNQERICKVEILNPKVLSDFYQNWDGVNAFNDGGSVWIFADRVESRSKPLFFQCNGFEKCMWNCIRSPSIVGKLKDLFCGKWSSTR